jgi:ribosomal protein L5
MQVPKLEKSFWAVSWAAVSDKKLIDYVDELTKITGQKQFLRFQRKRRCVF